MKRRRAVAGDLCAEAGFFIAADGGEAKEGHLKGSKDMVLHEIPFVLSGSFLMKTKPVYFDCEKRHFVEGVVEQKIDVSTARDISFFCEGEAGYLIRGKYFLKRNMGNGAEGQFGKLL